MGNFQTLHSHTTSSDGELDYLDVLKTCEENNISTVAFTDHDTVIDQQSLNVLRKYNGKCKWISGIEVSSGFPVELGGGPTSCLHIVGLFVDPTDKNLLEHSKLAKEARIERMNEIVRNLKKLGFIITEEMCLKESQGESVGRPHIVKALTSNPNNLVIIEKLRSEMETEAKTNPLTNEKYKKMIEQGDRQYPYTLFLDSESWIPNIYVDYKYFLDMDKSIKVIRDAGGIAILAHYFTCAKHIDEILLSKFFEEKRLDGIETIYGLFGLNTQTQVEKIILETTQIANRVANKYNVLKSGGADAHKKQDFIDFSNSGNYAQSTIGLIENIVSQSNVNTKWSNL